MWRSVTEPAAARPSRSPNDGRDRRVAEGQLAEPVMARSLALVVTASMTPRNQGAFVVAKADEVSELVTEGVPRGRAVAVVGRSRRAGSRC